MKKIPFIAIICFSLFLAAMINVHFSMADTTGTVNSPSSQSLTNPLGDIDSPNALIGKVINSIIGVVGSIALLMFIYGGFVWMLSGGNPNKIKQGREIIVWSILGLAVILFSYALVRMTINFVSLNF
jgi:hypothetical protein